jgi:hypothetical protein
MNAFLLPDLGLLRDRVEVIDVTPLPQRFEALMPHSTYPLEILIFGAGATTKYDQRAEYNLNALVLS